MNELNWVGWVIGFKYLKMKRSFTLIELLISISIAAIITAAVYFAFDSALESWGYTRDQLAVQKVLSQVIDEVLSGTVVSYGLRDSLEIVSAGTSEIKFVPPWTDDAHSAAFQNFVYTLNRKVKPGTAVPIGEMKLPEQEQYRLVSVKMVELEDTEYSQVQIETTVPAGSDLRFTYHPDWETHPDVIKTLWWDPDNYQVYLEDENGIENISKNPFGVEITSMEMDYYDNANNLIEKGKWIDDRDLNRITGVEVRLQARLGSYTHTLVSFINLRNAAMRSGCLILREGVRVSIPDSNNIHTLLVKNISGVSSNDELQITISPKSGKAWRVTVSFSRAAGAASKIELYTIEYPPGDVVYTEYPRIEVDTGLSLLALGMNGLYDYDNDEDLEDFVLLEGEVMLEVTKMDIEGASIFIKP